MRMGREKRVDTVDVMMILINLYILVYVLYIIP